MTPQLQPSKSTADQMLTQLLELAARRIQEVEAQLPTASSVSASSIRRLLRAARLRDSALLDLGRFVASASTEGLRVSFTEDVETSGIEDTDYVLDHPSPESSWQAPTVDLCVSDDAGDGEMLSAATTPNPITPQWKSLDDVLPGVVKEDARIPAPPRAPVTIPKDFLQPKMEQLAAEEGVTEGVLFDDIFRTYPRPETYGDATLVMSEMKAVMAWASETWTRLLTEQVGHLLNVSVPLLRHVQETVGVSNFELKSWFSRLTAISRAMKPRFVYGLAQDHTSEGRDSWLAAATRAYEEMSAYVEAGKTPELEPQGKMRQALEVLDAVKTGNPDAVLLALTKHADVSLHKYPAVFQGLRRYKDKLSGNPVYDRVMRAGDKKADKVGEEDEEEVSTFYEHITMTRGRRAAIVGGSPQARITERIKNHLQLDDLEWVETTPNAIRQVAAKQESGSLDFVFLLQEYVAHKNYKSLRRGPSPTGNLFVLVPNGYGLKSLCEALTTSLRVSGRIE